jgi:hypothetical protein
MPCAYSPLVYVETVTTRLFWGQQVERAYIPKFGFAYDRRESQSIDVKRLYDDEQPVNTRRYRVIPDLGVPCSLGAGVLDMEIGFGRGFVEAFSLSFLGVDLPFCAALGFQVASSAGVQFSLGSWCHVSRVGTRTGYPGWLVLFSCFWVDASPRNEIFTALLVDDC